MGNAESSVRHCPVCGDIFDGDDAAFERHVGRHFEVDTDELVPVTDAPFGFCNVDSQVVVGTGAKKSSRTLDGECMDGAIAIGTEGRAGGIRLEGSDAGTGTPCNACCIRCIATQNSSKSNTPRF